MRLTTCIWIVTLAAPFIWAEATLEGMADKQVRAMQSRMDEQQRVIEVGNADFVSALAMSKQPKHKR